MPKCVCLQAGRFYDIINFIQGMPPKITSAMGYQAVFPFFYYFLDRSIYAEMLLSKLGGISI